MGRLKKRKKGIWITKDGRQIPIETLENTHLKNIVNKLQKNKKEIPSDIAKEYKKRFPGSSILNIEKLTKVDLLNEIEFLESRVESLEETVENLKKWMEI